MVFAFSKPNVRRGKRRSPQGIDEWAEDAVARVMQTELFAGFKATEPLRNALLEAFLSTLIDYEVSESRDALFDAGNVDTSMPDELTDAKIAAAEARTDAKLEGFRGEFALIREQLGGIATAIKEQRAEANGNRTAVVTTVVGVGFALAALLLAAMSYGDAIFSRGMSVRDVVDAAVHDAVKQPPPKSP